MYLYFFERIRSNFANISTFRFSGCHATLFGGALHDIAEERLEWSGNGLLNGAIQSEVGATKMVDNY